MVRCWYDTCWQLILFRLEAFFGVVTHLQFQGRVVNWCLLVTQCGADGNRTSMIRKPDLIRSCTFLSDLIHLQHGGI